MSDRSRKIAKGIDSFVENPFTNLLKGVALLVIGFTDASRTFREDIAHGRLRVGHGMVILGFFCILGALPHLLEGLEASARYMELREEGGRPKGEGDIP